MADTPVRSLWKWPMAVVLILVGFLAGWRFSHGMGWFETKKIAGMWGPMVQQVTTDSFDVVWVNDRATAGRLQVATGGKELEVLPAKRDGTVWQVRVKGLARATGYTYKAVALQAEERIIWEGAGEVVTAGGPETPLRVLAFGDSGRGNENQWNLARTMTQRNADLILHVGDVVYGGGEGTNYGSRFFAPYAEMLKRLDFMPAVGNHDLEDGNRSVFQMAFDLPLNGPAGVPPESCFWFDRGPVRFVSFDSNRHRERLRQETVPWLDKVLSEPGPVWRIVYTHLPFYSGGSHAPSPELADMMLPVFDRNKVDLVLSGHNHLFERSFPMYGGHRVEAGSGTVYIVTGAGADNRERPEYVKPAEIECAEFERVCFSEMNITTDRLEFAQIDADGRTLDRLVLTPRQNGSL